MREQPVKAVAETQGPALSEPVDMAAARLPGTPAPAAKAEETKPSPQVSAAAPPPEAGDEEDPAEEVTEITLSSLSPMRVAVFERFNALWIVTDSTDASGSSPVIMGPMAEFITHPKGFKFDGGTGVPVHLPEEIPPARQKKQFFVGSAAAAGAPGSFPRPPGQRSIFDPVSKKASFLAALKGSGDAISFEDPDVGDLLYVVPVSQPDQAVRNRYRFADFETVPAQTGMVVRPLKDGVRVTRASDVIVLMSVSGSDRHAGGNGNPHPDRRGGRGVG